MRAYIADLHGKYYGTEIVVTDDEGNRLGEFAIGIGAGSPPSERENTSLINPTEEELQEYFSYGHHETELGYTIAKICTEAINNHEC